MQKIKTVPEKVKQYVKKNPKTENFSLKEANQIQELRNPLEITYTAYVYGFIKGSKAKKGGASND